MTGVEDRLRSALRQEADSVGVDDDRWETVEAKATTATRRRRGMTAGVSVLAIAAAVALVVGLVQVIGNDDGRGQRVRVGDEPPGAVAVPDSPPFWDRTFADPVDAATVFARDYLGMPDAHAGAYADKHVPIRPSAGSGPTTVVHVEPVPADPSRWEVVGARSNNLRLTSPAAFTTISSPFDLEGESTAFEGTVEVLVRQYNRPLDEYLSRSHYIGGGNGEVAPFYVSMVYDAPVVRRGAVVLETHSAKDGSISEATVVPVVFAGPGSDGVQPTRMVIVTVDGRVEDGPVRSPRLFATEGGRLGVVAASPDGHTAWVQVDFIDGARCNRYVEETRDGALVGKRRVGSFPDVSPDGTKLAYLDGGCDPEGITVETLGGGAKHFVTAPSHGTFARALSWAPDNRHLLVTLEQPPGGNGPHVALLDTEHDATLDDADVQDPGGDDGGDMDGFAIWMADRLVGERECCPQQMQIQYRGFRSVATGEVVLDPHTHITNYHADVTGTHVLYVTGTGELYRWNARQQGAVPVKLRDGVVDADW